ncbi:MAG: hypothetical protein ACREQA_19835 [Candidatus Binatia bacterium]
MNRYRVLRDLADDRAVSDIAEEYEVSVNKVLKFSEDNKEVIDEFRADIERWKRPLELWVTDKDHRMEEYQKDINRMEELMQYQGWDRGLQAEKGKLMRFVADEQGHLPTRASGNKQEGSTLNYSFEDVDLGDLT